MGCYPGEKWEGICSWLRSGSASGTPSDHILQNCFLKKKWKNRRFFSQNSKVSKLFRVISPTQKTVANRSSLEVTGIQSSIIRRNFALFVAVSFEFFHKSYQCRRVRVRNLKNIKYFPENHFLRIFGNWIAIIVFFLILFEKKL